VTLIGAGVTLHNCLAAADQLAGDGIHARVVDLYSVKPIDTQTLLDAAAATGDRIVVAEEPLPRGRPRQRGPRRVQRRGPPGRHQQPGRPRPARLRDAGRAHGGGGDLRRPHRASRPGPPRRPMRERARCCFSSSTGLPPAQVPGALARRLTPLEARTPPVPRITSIRLAQPVAVAHGEAAGSGEPLVPPPASACREPPIRPEMLLGASGQKRRSACRRQGTYRWSAKSHIPKPALRRKERRKQ
jgi:transketolase-like protein